MPEKLNKIQAKIDTWLSTSIWKLTSQSAVLVMITFRMLKKLKLCSYRAMPFHLLMPPNLGWCVNFCNWIIRFLNANGRMITAFDNVFFSDEARFHKMGYINTRNFWVWRSENPTCFRKPASIRKNLAFGAPSPRNGSSGQFFWGPCYGWGVSRCHKTVYYPVGSGRERLLVSAPQMRRSSFRAPFSASSLFPQTSGHRGAPSDYFLRGYLKNCVFRTPVESVEQLKDRITAEIAPLHPRCFEMSSETSRKRSRCVKGNTAPTFNNFCNLVRSLKAFFSVL